ncbi:MAG: ATP-binding protein [Planctomycetes bacterium]|jgi:SpoVK/Ycf46/Vps4 family AAA+-type ATPase|nr:ATP-binding protein [Planctomycetota bacterium]
MDLGPKLKRACDDSLHKAKMAWKAGDAEAAAAHFESASKAMFKYAEYAGSRAQEYARKKKAIEYRDFAKRLREVGTENAAGAAKKLTPPSGDPDDNSQRESTPEEGDTSISSAVSAMVHTSGITWHDIGGLDETKRDIKYALGLSLARPPEGVKITTFRNILFYGPPGTGKTLLAAATSNSLKVTTEGQALFFNVKVSGILSKYFGESSKIISELYGAARDNSPSVVFLDEFESLTTDRDSGEQSGAERRILSTILAELDGLSEKGRGDIFVLTIAATNRPWDIDAAVLSRFEKQILIPLPDAVSRRAILDIHLGRRGYQIDCELDELVAITSGYSGREIERLCKEATGEMIEELNADLPDVIDRGLAGTRAYQVKVRPLGKEDFLRAAEHIKPQTSPETMQRYLDWGKEQD